MRSSSSRCLHGSVLILLSLHLFLQWISVQHHRTLPSLDRGDTTFETVLLPRQTLRQEQHPPPRGAVEMPRLQFGDQETQSIFLHTEKPTPFNLSNKSRYELSIAHALSGCEPKLQVFFPDTLFLHRNTTFFWKPAANARQALNELLSYHIGVIFGFDRIPPVLPLQIPLKELLATIQRDSASHHSNWVSCDMPFTQERINRWVRYIPTLDTIHGSIPGEEFVIGSMQLKIGGIYQRDELVRWVDKSLVGWMGTGNTTTSTTSEDSSLLQQAHDWILPTEVSVLVQRERGTRALFDFLIGNIDRFNNDHIVVQPSITNQTHQNRLLVYIDHSRLSSKLHAFDLKQWTKACRFYHRPVERLRRTVNAKHVLMGIAVHINGNMVAEWMKYNTQLRKFPVPYMKIPVQKLLEQRIDILLKRVDECVAIHGNDHVFVQVE